MRLRSVFMSCIAFRGLGVLSADLHVIETTFKRRFESYLRSHFFLGAHLYGTDWFAEIALLDDFLTILKKPSPPDPLRVAQSNVFFHLSGFTTN